MPVSASAVIGGLSFLSNILGPLIGGDQQPEQINPELQGFLDRIKGMLGDAQGQSNNFLELLNRAIQDQQSQAGKMEGTISDIQGMKAPDPNAGFTQFLANIPGLEQTAASVAEKAYQMSGRNIMEQGNLASSMGARAAANSIPGGSSYSGAQAQAVSQGAVSPIVQALSQLANNKAQTFSSTFNNLAGQNQGLSFQAQQQGFENALGQLSQALVGQSQVGNIYSNIGQQRANQYGTSQNLIGSLINALSGVSGPAYSTPTTYDPLGSTTEGLSALAALLKAEK